MLEITGKSQDLILPCVLAFAYSLSFLCEKSHQDQMYFPEIINLSNEKNIDILLNCNSAQSLWSQVSNLHSRHDKKCDLFGTVEL